MKLFQDRALLMAGMMWFGLSVAHAQLVVTDPPQGHHFGKIPMGATYATQYFSVFNQGSVPTVIGQVGVVEVATCLALEGCPAVAPGDFLVHQHSDDCSNRILVSGAGCSTLVAFVPQSPGAKVAQLTFPVVGGGQATAMLSGTGTTQPTDCVLDWAERVLPELLTHPTSTLVVGSYFARCYQGGALCVGSDAVFPSFAPSSVYLYQGGQLTRYGFLSDLASLATQTPPSTLRCDQVTDR